MFWTYTLKKRPFFLDFVLYFIIKSLYYSEFCISLQISRFLEEPTFTPMLANLRLAYHPNPLQKPCNFIFYCKYNPFIPNDYFPLVIPPNVTRLLRLLAILAYPVLQQRHTSLPILQRRHRKNRDLTLHFARELFYYTTCIYTS